MKIIIVGFGNMGCRHLQSILNSNNKFEYFVLEPNKDIFLDNLKKIETSESRITYYSDIDSVPNYIDFAIIATSSNPRYQIIKILIEKGIKYFLLEKIVFQSDFQFVDIINQIEKNNCFAYCNFVSRYYPNYIDIKNNLDYSNPIKMIVTGGDFGLGCNSLHYIDLFEYLTGQKTFIIQSDIKENPKGNRRGLIYKELLGKLVLTNNKKDILIISAIEGRFGGNEIIVNQDNSIDILNEESRIHIHYSEINGLISKKFNILNTSYLTYIIISDILANKSLLPRVQDVKNSHFQLFSVANEAFGLNNKNLCPLT